MLSLFQNRLMRYPLVSSLLISVLFLNSCSSGKSAYKHGDYFEAVLTAVQRLRQNPDHKKSKEVLSLSYQPAINYLETDAQNQIASNANFKWRSAVQNYEKINQLYEEIRTSPGALRVIPNPVNKYNELTEVKAKAAEESYEAGVNAMLKNTRQDAKQAYFLFKEAGTLSPGYRESIEMMNQAEYNATLRVAYEELNTTRYNLGSLQPAVTSVKRQFLEFYPEQEAKNGTLPIDQNLKIILAGYAEGKPTITNRTENLVDSVKSGEKTVNGVKTPTYQKVTAKITYYDKSVLARGEVTIIITDKNGATIKNSSISGSYHWQTNWASFTGDVRALADRHKKLCEKKESNPSASELMNKVKAELDKNLSAELKGFYSQY